MTFLAGEDSLEFDAAITDDERRGEPPRESPREVKQKIRPLLEALRKEGLGEGAERNIESYFTVADAFEADGLLMQSVDYLEDLAHKLEELSEARSGRETALISSDSDILHFRDSHNVHAVDGKYLTGAQPTEKGYRWLKSKGVSAVINLRLHADEDRKTVERLGMEYFHIAWPDEHPPDPAQVKEMLRAVEETPGRVFQHCLRGIGRDMTMAGCYAIASGKCASALQFIKQGREEAPRWELDQKRDPESGEPVQFEFLRRFAEEWGK